jgi:hypothetical protein
VTTTSTELTELTGLSDHDLLAGGVWDQVAENRAAAQRLARMDEFRRRRESNYKARRAADPHFTLTPMQETTVEAGELYGMDSGRVSAQLGMVRALTTYFTDVWEMCLDGQLDTYRAGIVADTARYALDHPEEFAVLAARVTAWLKAGVTGGEDRPALCTRTVKQLRNKVNYELNRIKTDADERFRRAFKERKATMRDHEDGTASLTLGNSIDQVQLADYRLTLAAQQKRAEGDGRTIEQLRTDLALDLLLGRDSVSTPKYARPVVMLTVPIQTVIGIADEPGTLSGGAVVPPSLARIIAQQPGATWYRMLTDPAGRCVELSTKSYRPTAPIWRQVVGTFGSCFRRGCTTPATEAELDHREPWPKGETSTTNLQPGCPRDHKAKHAEGFSIEQNADGTLTLTTRAGFAHTTERTQHPVSDTWPHESAFQIQFTPTELVDALNEVDRQQEENRPRISDDILEELRGLGRTA